MGQSKFFAKYPCRLCGRLISNNGMAQASHNRSHVRNGHMVEVTDKGSTAFETTAAGLKYWETRRVDSAERADQAHQ